jgi:hypothetical protein
MSKLEILTIEWFTLKEKQPEQDKDLLFQLDSGSIVPAQILCLVEKDRSYYITDNFNYYLDEIKYWAYCVEPSGID